MAISLGTDVVLKSTQGRSVLAATILGSGMAALDGTIVNVALPRIGQDLHAGLTALQWTVNAYTLTLSGLLLLGGSLGDRLGRRRIFLIGVLWFTLASVGCAAAPTPGVLIGLRAVQGVGAALLTPGSLAILEAVFLPEDRAAAVGAWSGLGGVATAIGPVLGGLLIGISSWGWRLVFFLNVPLARGRHRAVAAVRARDARRERSPAASTSSASCSPRSVWRCPSTGSPRPRAAGRRRDRGRVPRRRRAGRLRARGRRGRRTR